MNEWLINSFASDIIRIPETSCLDPNVSSLCLNFKFRSQDFIRNIFKVR